MAAAKIVSFLCSDTPGALALTGPAGCGKRHAIAEAARQAGVAVAHHDLAQGTIEWGRLGSQQLTSTGLMRSVHVISNASEQFLKDFAFAKKTHAKIVLVADDAGPSMRAGGVPVVRMQALSVDAMAKKLFHEGWSAEAALNASRGAQGNWHQLRAQALFPEAACGSMDATLANEPPYAVASRLLNGTAPEACSLDPLIIAWTERNQAVHCDDIEVAAQRQEAMAAATMPFLDASAVGEELFKTAARYRSKRVYDTFGLYANPWQKDGAVVRAIGESYGRQRATFTTRLKESALQKECEADKVVRASAKVKGKGKAKTTKAKAKSKAKQVG